MAFWSLLQFPGKAAPAISILVKSSDWSSEWNEGDTKSDGISLDSPTAKTFEGSITEINYVEGEN